MLIALIPIVEKLCNMAEVVGLIYPPNPSNSNDILIIQSIQWLLLKFLKKISAKIIIKSF